MKTFATLAILILTVGIGNAEDMCYERAAVEYYVNPDILKAISKVESNHNPRALNRNRNMSVDAGHMQINSAWASILKKNYNYLYNPCYSTRAGAWVLRQCMNQYGNTWDAVACYHTGPIKTEKSIKQGAEYIKKVKRALQSEKGTGNER